VVYLKNVFVLDQWERGDGGQPYIESATSRTCNHLSNYKIMITCSLIIKILNDRSHNVFCMRYFISLRLMVSRTT